MDDADASVAVASIGLEARRATPILGGWAYWTFDVDGAWIVRFPRTDEIAAAAGRELRLLPELARHLSCAVPAPSHQGTWDGRPFFAYPRIPGRGARPSDGSPPLLDRLRAVLGELHSFPVDDAAEVLGIGDAAHAWRRHFEALWPAVKGHALPQLAPALADRVRREFADFLDGVDELPCALVHNDLGLEHVLVDEHTGELTGLIDFEDATIGDPAIDLTPLRAAFGRAATSDLLAPQEAGDHLEERLRFYRWMGSVHAIIHGVTQDDAAEIAHAHRELITRLDSTVGA